MQKTGLVLAFLPLLEKAVQGGRWFEPGHPVPLGMRGLRIVARDDDTLGFEERTESGEWTEQVDQTLAEHVAQLNACDRLGLPISQDWLHESDLAIIQPCALESESIILDRKVDSSWKGHSGWRVFCGTAHEHRDLTYPPLSEVVAACPSAAQFLRLPDRGRVSFQPPESPDGVIAVHAWYQEELLNSGQPTWFPELGHQFPWIRRALWEFAPGHCRTSVGESAGLPDVVARVNDPAAGDVSWVLDDIQYRICEEGFRFTAGQTIQCGARTLRLIDRPDGFIGLQERLPGNEWSEQVDNTLREQSRQRRFLRSMGAPDDWLQFPADHQQVRVGWCVNETTSALVFARAEEDGLSRFSGWTLTCDREHDHAAENARPIWELCESFPFLAQLLPLPPNLSVHIDLPGGAASDAIRFRILTHGLEIVRDPDFC
ncbi:hypothetical protein D5S18_20960 [Nocardia panacis]|uniref:Uncharacterized protein n=2 Tax=Nocardia panacis TaxID=2340916 RepID=A0A3A4K7Z4_9NOCA|nr:hypothetical protein D5S18_20960 [Nocardia panacis]